MTTGQRIKARREELGISVDWLAEQIGRRRSTVYRYENSEVADIPSKVFQKIADCLETTPSSLLGWYDTPVVRTDGSEEPAEPRDPTGVSPLGKRIMYRREWLRMSQSELALITGLPDRESVAKIESGKNQIPVDKVRAFADALKVPVHELIDCNDAEWATFCKVWKLLNE